MYLADTNWTHDLLFELQKCLQQFISIIYLISPPTFFFDISNSKQIENSFLFFIATFSLYTFKLLS